MRVGPFGRKNEIEIEEEDKVSRVEFMYPEIYNKNSFNYLIVGLCHTRAADDIRIHYESERDGWSIEQATKFQWEVDDKDCDPGWVEVAFIEAWGSDPNHGEMP